MTNFLVIAHLVRRHMIKSTSPLCSTYLDGVSLAYGRTGFFLMHLWASIILILLVCLSLLWLLFEMTQFILKHTTW